MLNKKEFEMTEEELEEFIKNLPAALKEIEAYIVSDGLCCSNIVIKDSMFKEQ